MGGLLIKNFSLKVKLSVRFLPCVEKTSRKLKLVVYKVY